MQFPELPQVVTYLLIAMGISLVIALVGLALMVKRVRTMHIPATTDLFTTLHHVPLMLVVLLDLLDFSLDIFSAPIAWAILNRMGLSSLRNTATIQAAIPISNTIPVLTIAWFAVRVFKLGSIPGHSASLLGSATHTLEDHANRQSSMTSTTE
jgi:hypothetical protein